MADNVIPVPFSVRDYSLIIDGVEYAKTTSQVEFQPVTSSATFTGGQDFSWTDTVVTGWNAVIAWAQDWLSTDSLSNLFFDRAGETLPVVFKPQKQSAEGSPAFYTSITLMPGNIGGTVPGVGVSTITIGLASPPSKTPPAEPTP